MDNKVREFRNEMGMSVSELARRAGTSRQTIYAIETKVQKNIRGALMFSIADALKKPEREIFFNKNVNHGEQSA